MALFKKNNKPYKNSIFNEEFKQKLFSSINIGFLRGLVNIDGGHLGISTDWLPACLECENSYLQSQCSKCGRNKNNYVDFRSGRGDGVYPVIDICDTDITSPKGFLILFDFEVGLTSIGQVYSSYMQDLAQLYSEPEELGNEIEHLSLLWDSIMASYPEDLQIYDIADLEVKSSKSLKYTKDVNSIIVVGESGEGIDSNSSLVTIFGSDSKETTYKVFLVGRRDTDNNNAFIPNLALIIENDFSDEIGLNSNIISKLDLLEEKKLWNNASVASYIGNPQNLVAIASNYIYLNACRILSENEEGDFENQKMWANSATRWLALLNYLQPNDEVKNLLNEFINHYDMDITELNELRGQFNRKII